MTKDELVEFEKEVARRFEAGEIHAPIHLSGGNEDQLLEIFQNISRDDLVLSHWRSHHHALLHGVPPDELMRQILAGRSMHINSVKPWFYASSIAGGVLPIAVGLGMAIKRNNAKVVERVRWSSDNCLHSRIETFSDELPFDKRHVWCFVGDMMAASGLFEETTKYALNFKLPVTFVIEDNAKSVLTTTADAWGNPWPYEIRKNVTYYKYELSWPHSGIGRFVAF